MHAVQTFLNSFSPEQWALVIGFLTWLSHSVLDRNKKLGSELNYFIVRFTTVVFPALTAFATDPNINAVIHSYFPAAVSFFAVYQGLYVFTNALAAKIREILIEVRLANAKAVALDEPETI